MPAFQIQCQVISVFIEKVHFRIAPARFIRLKILVQPVGFKIVQPVDQVFVPVHQHIPVFIRQRRERLIDLCIGLLQVKSTLLVYFIGNEIGVAYPG